MIKTYKGSGKMTKEELNKLIILNTNIKTGEPLFLVSYPYLFKLFYEGSDSIKEYNNFVRDLGKKLFYESLDIEEDAK
jgi:hypothetical protein